MCKIVHTKGYVQADLDDIYGEAYGLEQDAKYATKSKEEIHTARRRELEDRAIRMQEEIARIHREHQPGMNLE